VRPWSMLLLLRIDVVSLTVGLERCSELNSQAQIIHEDQRAH
jgi:hypothetical protein